MSSDEEYVSDEKPEDDVDEVVASMDQEIPVTSDRPLPRTEARSTTFTDIDWSTANALLSTNLLLHSYH